MTKRLLSMLLSVALLLSCVSGITLFTAAEETLPEPYGSFDFLGTDGAIRMSGNGIVVRHITTTETADGITAGTAIGDTGLYGYTVDTAGYGLYVGGAILNKVPDGTDIVYAVEYYIDSETPLTNTTLTVNGGNGTVSEFANLPVGQKGVALYHLSAAKVDEIQANVHGGDTRVRIYIPAAGVGKLYVTGFKILDARYATTPINPGYAYFDAGTVGACTYYPDLPAASVNQMWTQDAEITDTFAGYRYYKFAAEAAAHSSSATENKPVYIKVYTNESNQNTPVAINTYQIYGEKNDGTGTAATHNSLIKDAKSYSITVKDGVGGVYMPATCFRNGAGIGSFRLDMANANKVTRIEVYDVATYCNEANATAEMKAELHKGMVANDQNVAKEGYVAPTPEAPGATGAVKCVTCGEVLTENSVIPQMTNYAKLDFSSGELVGTAASASGCMIEKIPGTEYYGAKLNKQNQQINFYLTDAFTIAASAIENGTDLAITYEYYATDGWSNDSRLTLIGNGYNLGINGGGVNNVWDCLPVNVGSALKRGELNIVTYTVGAGSQYTAQFDGNIGNGTTAVAGTAYSTLSQAKALAEGKSFNLICWNNDGDGSKGKDIYLKSITICDAAELGDITGADDGYYIDFVGEAVNPYYPEYTEKTSNGLSHSENRVEWYKQDEAQEYPRFHYMYVKVLADLLSDKDTLVATPVKLVIERKDGCTADGFTFQYQDGYSGDERWSATQTVTFDENGRYELDLLDARFFNGLNENASIRLRSVLYEQTGDAESGYTYELVETDNLEDIAVIRLYDLREECEAYHDQFTEGNGNLKWDGRVEATYDEEGFTGNLVCAHCGDVMQEGTVIPTLKPYAKFDFSNGTADLTSVMSLVALDGNTSLVPVQIPGTEAYGLKLVAHNSGVKFRLAGFGGFTAEDILDGQEIAVSVEYYVPGDAVNSTRIVFDGENGAHKIVALYTNYGGTTWDAAVLNAGAPMSRDQLNVATFKVGANVNYVTGPGQFSAANKFDVPQTVNTLELAQDLVSNGTIVLRGWGVNPAAEDDPETEKDETAPERAVYIKSITIYDAADADIRETGGDVEYIDYVSEHTESPKYYPEYSTVGSANGIAGLQVTEQVRDDGDITYVYYSVTKAKKPADKDMQPVVIRFTMKEGCERKELNFAYQTAAPWTYLTLDINDGVAEAVLPDAAFTNGLNGKGSFRLTNGVANDKLVDDIAKIEVFVVQDNTALKDALSGVAELVKYKTPASVEAYMAVVEEAQAVADDPWATAEEIAAAAEALTAAADLLVDCDHLCGTELVGYVAETCLTEGYSGDYACIDCGFIAEEDYGTAIPAHETRLINVKETSCKEAGYTGDLWCEQCQAVAKEGNVIAKLPHTFDDGVVTKAPTAQEYGELTRTCTGCGEKMTVRLEFEAQLGDVNGDGKIDSTDARLVLQFAVKKIAPTALDLSVADVNGDGKTDSTDARLILQLAVGKIKEFPKEA